MRRNLGYWPLKAAMRGTMFSFPIRVYYEDTDAAGVVYYANYLKFAERARTEWLRSFGVSQHTMLEKDGVGFVVSHVSAAYKAPARLDEEIHVDCTVTKLGKVRISMQQTIRHHDKILVALDVDIACVDREFSPARLPETLQAAFAAHMH